MVRNSDKHAARETLAGIEKEGGLSADGRAVVGLARAVLALEKTLWDLGTTVKERDEKKVAD